jgi:hypothetical protein
MYVSSARGHHRIWWGESVIAWCRDLPIAYTNPRQLIANSVGTLGSGPYYVETGLTNMGMPGSKKIAVSVGVRIETPAGTVTLVDPPTVEYRTHDGETYTALLGPYNAAGVVTVPDGTVPDTYFYWFDADFEGLSFDEIELKFTWQTPFLIKWAALYFAKVIAGNLAWTVTLDLTNTYEDQSPAVMNAALDRYIVDENIVDFIYRETTYKVRVASWSGADSSGRADTRGMRSVQLIQIKDRP